MKKMRAYFKTNLNQKVRYFDVSSADFGRQDGPLMLDIECPGPENIGGQFVPYSREKNEKLLAAFFGLIFGEPGFKKHLFDNQGIDVKGVELKTLVAHVAEKMEHTDFPGTDIEGEWTGQVTLKTAKGERVTPVSLVLKREGGGWSGTFQEKAGQKEGEKMAVSNVRYKGGLLSFSVKAPFSVDLLHFELHLWAKGLRGSLGYWNRSAKRFVNLKKK